MPAERLLDEVAALKYVAVENAPVYRAVVEVFAEARSHYVVELRPGDVLSRLRAAHLAVPLADEPQLEYHLDRLVEWGNLQRSHDTAAVARIEDFYRRRFLYRLSAVGEAAHRAVEEVERAVGRSGSLQSSMLGRIAEALRSALDASRAADAPKARAALHDLGAAFRALTEEANRFIGDLDEHVAGERLEEERFLLYKRAVLAYLSGFVERLRRHAAEIAELAREVDVVGFDGLARLAVEAAELPPSPDGADPRPAWVAEEAARWAGVRAWFAGDAAGPPRVERLAEVARDAVVRLARSLSRLDERRSRAADRAADFRTLARWFQDCRSDDEAHRLWHIAFGLASARHFHVAEEDAGASSPGASWWDSEPVRVPVRLRTHGRTSEAGRPSPIPDHSDARAWMLQLRRRERAAAEAALSRFAGRGRQRLSALSGLSSAELDALLGLLDDLLVAPPGGDGLWRTRTADARHDLALRAPPEGAPWARLGTGRGVLVCRDHELEVVPVARTALRAVGGES